jgi:hypothetical protein
MRHLVVALALLVGCVPKQQTAVRTVTRTVQAPRPISTGAVVVTTERLDNLVVVSAVWPRRCRRDVVDEVLTVRKTNVAIVGTSDGDTWGWFLALPAAIIIWPVGLASGAISLAVVASSDSSTKTTTETSHSVTIDCPTPAADVAVHFTLPSGAMVDARTDERGQFALLVPPTEPVDAITVTTDAPKPPVPLVAEPAPPSTPPPSPPPDAPPAAPRSGIPAIGRAATECGAQFQLTGIANIEVAMASDGSITHVETNRGTSFTSCMRSKLDGVKVPSTAGRALKLPFLLKKP